MNVHQLGIDRQRLLAPYDQRDADTYLAALLRRRQIRGIIIREDGRGIPIVDGELLFDQRTGRQIVGVEIHCPWCSCRHTHGAGPNPGDGDGHRVAHCLAHPRFNTGYIIREVRR